MTINKLTTRFMYTHLNTKDRILITFLLKRKYSYRRIAKELNVNVSTISREIKRNSDNNRYSTVKAKKKSLKRRLKSKEEFRIIENNILLKKETIKYLKQYYSPEQISGILKLKININISFKTIYAFLKRSYPLGKYYLRHPKRRRNYGIKGLKEL